MLRVGILTVFLVSVLLGCGGAQTSAESAPGDTHASAPGDDLDLPAAMDGDSPDGQSETGEAAAVVEEPALVTFRMVNTADEDLAFSVEKGWQTVFIAFSGKPPNAKPIVMFPKHCTASCALSAEEVCPVCAAPETVNEVKAAEERQIVAAGASLDVPWDGQIYVYEKTKGTRNGRKQSCECFETAEVPPETYTVRACGLRITKTAKSSTKLQCADASMTMPTDEPQVVTFEFPAP
ncbi:hypothetical protein [Haliangium ochraceum]|uniref:Lipoprotein n=1 Tax=Haliangium ochraceum (strain DSM 14365 / JCM 11303 / SMP-2) TaxID=502025 RepID=D0LNQ0_HALO1|nr:hypothetical protein [Haliangium ochraceum]ACY16955.1 hypothetical protein Hoch_4462 [Haliangium ochraceum DSM 14365]